MPEGLVSLLPMTSLGELNLLMFLDQWSLVMSIPISLFLDGV